MLSDPEKLTSIRENRDPRDAAKQSYKNYFYVGSSNGMGDVELMADFTQLACVPASEYPAIMKSKILQMKDVERMKFKLKLGFFLAKPTDEENAPIAADPWSIGDKEVPPT